MAEVLLAGIHFGNPWENHPEAYAERFAKIWQTPYYTSLQAQVEGTPITGNI